MSDAVVSIGADFAEFNRTVGRSLNEFGKMSSQAAGRANVFARALATIGAQGSQTSQIVGSILGGFAAGGAIGLAIGGVNALVGVFRDLNTTQTEALDKSTKWGEELNRQIQQNRDDLLLLWAEMEGGAVGGAQAQAAIARRDAEAKVAEAKKVVLDLETRLQAIQKPGLDNLKDRALGQEKLAEQIKAAQANVAAAEQYRAEVVAATSVKVQGVRQAEARKVAEQLAREEAGRERLAAEAHIWAWEEQKAAEEAIEKISEAEERAREEERDAEEAALVESLEMEQYWADQRVKSIQEAAQEYERALAPIGNAFSTLFQDIALEQKSGLEAFKSFMAGLASYAINTLVQMGVQAASAKIAKHAVERPVKIAEVTSAAGVAGAEGAASLAGIPFVGPAMAASWLTTFPATVMSSMIPLASARGGWEVPAFGSEFPAILHPREMVLPAKYADVMRGLASGEGGRGAAAPIVNMNVSTMDARSFLRSFRGRKAELVTVLRELLRDGRFP